MLHSLLGWEFHKGRYYVTHLYVQCIKLKCISVTCLTFLNLSVPSFGMCTYYLPLYHRVNNALAHIFLTHIFSSYGCSYHLCIGLVWWHLTLATPWKTLPSPGTSAAAWILSPKYWFSLGRREIILTSSQRSYQQLRRQSPNVNSDTVENSDLENLQKPHLMKIPHKMCSSSFCCSRLNPSKGYFTAP